MLYPFQSTYQELWYQFGLLAVTRREASFVTSRSDTAFLLYLVSLLIINLFLPFPLHPFPSGFIFFLSPPSSSFSSSFPSLFTPPPLSFQALGIEPRSLNISWIFYHSLIYTPSHSWHTPFRNWDGSCYLAQLVLDFWLEAFLSLWMARTTASCSPSI